jgi:hypothetical protein
LHIHFWHPLSAMSTRVPFGAVPLLIALHLTNAVLAQQALVVPAAHATTDAPSYGWLGGASRPLRQQTLIGPSHLLGRSGQTITAIELRRNAANEIYAAGDMHWTVTLSTLPLDPLAAVSVFAANTGASPVQVFSGVISLPASPAAVGPAVGWAVDNVIRVPLQVPFQYSGGTLCMDVFGTPIQGQNANWWMADFALDDIRGSTSDLGGGCGIYGSVQSEWSHVATRSLVVGAYAHLSAFGTPGGLAIAAIGNKNAVGVPLSLVGLPAGPTCLVRLANLFSLTPALFDVPANANDLPFGGKAELFLKLPNVPSALGATFTAQWVDWSQSASSNAIECTVSPQVPALDMAFLEGPVGEAEGLLSVHIAPVVRFEF